MKYTVQSYSQLISQSYCFSQEQYDTCDFYPVLKALYDKNYVNGTGESKIPHRIHQIWLGGKLPDKFRRFADSWQKFHPTWEYMLWGEEEAAELGLIHADYFRAAVNQGQRSDILRHEILYQLGGLYVDTDFECLKPFDDLMYLDYFTGSGYAKRVVELYPALIGSIPKHPISERYIMDMVRIDSSSYRRMFETTGPYYYTDCFLKAVNKDTPGVVAFPPKFFYPWPNNDLKSQEPYSYVKSYSYAIHHWAVSWASDKRKQYGLDSR